MTIEPTVDRATPIWPFPGDNTPWWHAYPPHNLPPPRFAIGDRVTTRWGSATVLQVHDWEHFGSRGYHLRYDFSSSPPGFGHTWSEADMHPLAEHPAESEDDEVFHVPPKPGQQASQVEQLRLF